MFHSSESEYSELWFDGQWALCPPPPMMGRQSDTWRSIVVQTYEFTIDQGMRQDRKEVEILGV